MKFDKLKPGMVVYDVAKTKMGNTPLRTVSVYNVRILEVDLERRVVTVSWNGNAPRTYSATSDAVSKWRAKRPMLVRSAMGVSRVATKEEQKAAQLAGQKP